MALSLPKSRKAIRQQEAVAAKLRSELRENGITRHSQRERLMRKAASSRPADIAQKARWAVDNRRAIAMVERLQGGVQ